MSNAAQVTPEMEERKEPRFVQFSSGDVVEGLLVSVLRVKIEGKDAVRYIVLQDDDELVSFLGTYIINTKLSPADRGHRISVRYEGENPQVKRGENCMKMFKVLVSKKAVLPLDSLGITDDDIPF
jgi:hypothetical protein